MAVSKPDFTRQFGSAKADLNPVSNSNYVQGWDYVGSTPPTKNDFTYLQNLADQRSIWLFENYGAGRLIGRQIFTASGSYTPTPGTRYIKFRIAGGGGGGGGCPATAAGQQAAANGGQSGAYVEGVSTTISSTSSYGIVVGNAGTAGTSSSAGTAGGASTISGIVSVPGGAVGSQGVASGATLTLGNSSPGTVYATITSGAALVSLPANVGEPFTVVGNGTAQVRGGRGGSSPFGIGGAPGVGGPGQPPRGYGAGGGGCSQVAGSAGDVGGSGSTGLIIIEEFS